jgi:hypothetical protein
MLLVAFEIINLKFSSKGMGWNNYIKIPELRHFNGDTISRSFNDLEEKSNKKENIRSINKECIVPMFVIVIYIYP